MRKESGSGNDEQKEVENGRRDTGDQYLAVTETSGQYVSAEQYSRHCNRYYWAAEFCTDKDVLEVACGSAAGIGYLARYSASIIGVDISEAVLASPRRYYGNRADLRVMDGQALEFSDRSFDVIIIFEAMYYLPSVERFVAECARVLRPGGQVLVCNANKDLYDFNKSPFSVTYHGVVELEELFARHGFAVEFWGGSKVSASPVRQKILRPAKALASRLRLIPRSMAGKRFLKRLVFGKLFPLPAEIEPNQVARESFDPVPPGRPDREHKVIYCVATLQAGNH